MQHALHIISTFKNMYLFLYFHMTFKLIIEIQARLQIATASPLFFSKIAIFCKQPQSCKTVIPSLNLGYHSSHGSCKASN